MAILKTIRLPLKNHPCVILVGPQALAKLPGLIRKMRLGPQAVIVTTDTVKILHAKKLLRKLKHVCQSTLLITVPDSEKSKSAQSAFRLIKKITLFDKRQGLFLIAFGGGVIGDLTGFIASIYKRGVPYIQIPTTLLSQIDSSIGGKTAIDTEFGKNLIGAFYQPRFTIADVSFLKSLPAEQIKAGLAEAAKYAIANDPDLFTFLLKHKKAILAREVNALTHLVAVCARIKSKIVVKDEFDKKNIRIVLNFGHTFGHGFEAASKFKISHGQGVSIGIACAVKLSAKLGLLAPEMAQNMIGLLQKLGLPTHYRHYPPEAILKAMHFDKKSQKGINRFVLTHGLGKTKIVSNVSETILKEILRGQKA